MAVGSRACGARVLWGTSFDGVAVSGVVIEFIKLARFFRDHGYRIHLDLGYDIKADKGNFFRPYTDEADVMPSWICLDRIDGLDQVEGYDQQFACRVLRDVVQERAPERSLPRVAALSAALARRIVWKWQMLGVSLVVIENGTLPENITYTKALYEAIEEYGHARGLGTYVLWRDHDLMWSSEPGTRKYGEFPYRGTVRPTSSPFIRYLTLHDQACRELLDWAPELPDATVLPNTFTHVRPVVDKRNADFRVRFGIPPDAFLIGRYTRVIPQKRLDRDVYLLAAVNAELAVRGVGRPAFLWVSALSRGAAGAAANPGMA